MFPFPSAGADVDMSIDAFLDELAIEAHRRMQASSQRTRPHLLLNMASTADGRASVSGRAGPIGDRADSALLHGLRTIADGLLVGAHTVRVEHYARVLRGQQDRDARRDRGLSEQLRTFIVSGSLDITPQSVPLLAEPQAPVTVVTSSRQGELGECAAQVDYLRCESGGELDLPAALRRMHSEHGVHTLLCEGGPRLAGQMISAGLVDELFLSLACKLAGGEQHLRILAGPELDPPLQVQLASAYEHESSLFLRYRLGG
jgi:5-amino-6-(5-phosphoribosylamino)uracil reductase